MPHRCTGCGRGFADGSREVLSGCPDCGGSTFQFLPDGGAVEAGEGEAAGDSDAGDGGGRGSAADVGRAAASGDDARGSLPRPDRPRGGGRVGSGVDWPGRGDEAGTTVDEAGTTADDAGTTADDAGTTAGETETADATRAGEPAGGPADTASTGGSSADTGPDVGAETVRAELDSQFESIRIVGPGQYELNLMELYESDEHVVAVQQDGRYIIDVTRARVDAE